MNHRSNQADPIHKITAETPLRALYARLKGAMHAALLQARLSGAADAKALFISEKISDFATVAISFLFDKYCPTMN
jgi:hypothetical protein